MSLNWREINLILSELQLSDAYLRGIAQPQYSELLFLLWHRNENIVLRISHAPQYCALHRSELPFRKAKGATRLVELLNSRVLHGRILSLYQLGTERILRMTIRKEQQRTLLWIRLWSGAANTIVTDTNLVIIDALFRRPRRGEVSGRTFIPLNVPAPLEGDYPIRPYSAPTFNNWVDSHYRLSEMELQRARHIKQLKSRLTKLLRQAEQRLKTLTKDEQWSAQHYRLCGELLLANIAQVPQDAEWVTLPNEQEPKEITIELNPTLSAQQNAQHYFKRYRDALRQGQRSSAQQSQQQSEIAQLQGDLKKLHNCSEGQLDRLMARYQRAASSSSGRRSPARQFQSDGYVIFAGRSARDNDWLMRHIARPHDMWLHARGTTGSTVLIRSSAKKSIPQTVLIDAAMLALYYSNERSNGGGEVHYTEVKFVRRPKGRKEGNFIPYREKNLSVDIEEGRIAYLQKAASHVTLVGKR